MQHSVECVTMSEISPAKACERKLVVLEARYCSAAKLYMLSCFFGDSCTSLARHRHSVRRESVERNLRPLITYS